MLSQRPAGRRDRAVDSPHERRPRPDRPRSVRRGHPADSLTLSVLPDDIRARLVEDPNRPVRFRDPATGRRWALAPDPAPARPPLPGSQSGSQLTEAELDEIDRRLEGLDFAAAQTGTDVEAIRRGLAQADAGELMTLAEGRAFMEARVPFLKG